MVWTGVIVFSGIITAAVKVITLNKVNRKEAFSSFQTQNMCNQKHKNVEDKIDALSDHISERFDDLKCIIQKSNNK